jgi:hypothetical protein
MGVPYVMRCAALILLSGAAYPIVCPEIWE